jgi:hypothetical protein
MDYALVGHCFAFVNFHTYGNILVTLIGISICEFSLEFLQSSTYLTRASIALADSPSSWLKMFPKLLQRILPVSHSVPSCQTSQEIESCIPAAWDNLCPIYDALPPQVFT